MQTVPLNLLVFLTLKELATKNLELSASFLRLISPWFSDINVLTTLLFLKFVKIGIFYDIIFKVKLKSTI